MTKSNAFLSDYKLAPNPMAGVAGRMKSMAAQSKDVGGGRAVDGALDAGLAGNKAQEALAEQSRQMTVMNAQANIDKLSNTEKMERARLDYENAGSFFQDLTYGITATKAINQAAGMGLSKMEGPGGIVKDPDTGEDVYQPGTARGPLAGILRILRNGTNIIPANLTATEARENLKEQTAWTKYEIDQAVGELDEDSASTLTYLDEADGLFSDMTGNLQELSQLNADDSIAGIQKYIQQMHESVNKSLLSEDVLKLFEGPPRVDSSSDNTINPLPPGTQGPMPAPGFSQSGSKRETEASMDTRVPDTYTGQQRSHIQSALAQLKSGILGHEDSSQSFAEGRRLILEAAATQPYYTKDQLVNKARQYASKAGIPTGLFFSIISNETRWNQYMVSYAGAFGLTQMLKGTFDGSGGAGKSPFDVDASLEASASYLSELNQEITQFRGRPATAWEIAHAYHDGFGGFKRWVAMGEPTSAVMIKRKDGTTFDGSHPKSRRYARNVQKWWNDDWASEPITFGGGQQVTGPSNPVQSGPPAAAPGPSLTDPADEWDDF